MDFRTSNKFGRIERWCFKTVLELQRPHKAFFEKETSGITAEGAFAPGALLHLMNKLKGRGSLLPRVSRTPTENKQVFIYSIRFFRLRQWFEAGEERNIIKYIKVYNVKCGWKSSAEELRGLFKLDVGTGEGAEPKWAYVPDFIVQVFTVQNNLFSLSVHLGFAELPACRSAPHGVWCGVSPRWKVTLIQSYKITSCVTSVASK